MLPASGALPAAPAAFVPGSSSLMVRAAPSDPAAEDDAVPARLDDLERAVLLALDAAYVSTTVVKCRAGVPMNQRVGPTLRVCIELERRGMVESVGSGSARRWRRVGAAALA